MITEVQWEQDAAAWRVGETKHHIIHIIPMYYNHRIVLTPKDDEFSYDVGWCYPTEAAAFQAVAEWNPAVDDEPRGYLKRIDWMLPVGDPRRNLT